MALRYETFRNIVIKQNEIGVPQDDTLWKIFDCSVRHAYETLHPTTRRQAFAYAVSFWAGQYFGVTEGEFSGQQNAAAVLDRVVSSVSNTASELRKVKYVKPPWLIPKPEHK
jgi:hypothetical protein